MILLYENEWGRLTITKEYGLCVKEISGLGLPQSESSVVSYANQPGQVFISSRDMARVITLSCDVLSGADGLSRMIKIMHHPGRLTVISNGKMRAISCRCTTIDESVRRGPYIRSVVLQFTCDKPYFTDISPSMATLFSREDLICDEFMMPCLFSKRVNRCLIYNRGDFRTEPVFTIYNILKEEKTTSEQEGIELINHTTGQHLLLECNTEFGETITIDIPGRSIMSSLKGNLSAILSENSFLSNFWLESGVNDLEAINYNTGESLDIKLSFENQYLEAVV